MEDFLESGHSVGLEKEFYVVDGNNGMTNDTYNLVHDIGDRMEKELGAYDSHWGPKCYEDLSGPLEITTRPCKDLHQLTKDITTSYKIAQDEAEKNGLYALGMGTRPGKNDDHAGLHVHVGFKDEGEAEYVFHALQKHVPDIMALSANSPTDYGAFKDIRQVGGLFTQFAENLLAVPTLWGHNFSRYGETSRRSVIYMRENTVEVRCMDSQGSGEEDAAIGAYIFGIAEKAKEDYANGVPMAEVGRWEEKNFKRALIKGMKANFKVDGEKVKAYEVVEDTFDEIMPYLKQYKCPKKVLDVLESKIEGRRSGADDILDIYKEELPQGFLARLIAPFRRKEGQKERLIKHLAYRDEFKEEPEPEDAMPWHPALAAA